MTTTQSRDTTAQALLTLSDASHRITGRPSTSAVWRWCRRGVMARDGQRIRLKHRRIGGKIFTSPEWIDEFTEALTNADTAYFAAKQQAADELPPRAAAFDAPKRPRKPRRARAEIDPERQMRVSDELDREGL